MPKTELAWVPAGKLQAKPGVAVTVVDLAGNKVIEAILVGRTPSHRLSATPPQFRPVSKRRGCRCGRCRACADNARWERIFREKFADPDYYKPRRPACESPLNCL